MHFLLFNKRADPLFSTSGTTPPVAQSSKVPFSLRIRVGGELFWDRVFLSLRCSGRCVFFPEVCAGFFFFSSLRIVSVLFPVGGMRGFFSLMAASVFLFSGGRAEGLFPFADDAVTH